MSDDTRCPANDRFDPAFVRANGPHNWLPCLTHTVSDVDENGETCTSIAVIRVYCTMCLAGRDLRTV